MLIPALMSLYMPYGFWMFKSRDWVDVDSGALLALSHRSESDLQFSPTLGDKRGKK